jgi:DNA double-strand break repair helicase HerA and related ATPase
LDPGSSLSLSLGLPKAGPEGFGRDDGEVVAMTIANAYNSPELMGATMADAGKTVTLQVLAEGFSNAGVPVFAADIKGDLSGVAQPGDGKPPFVKRAQEIGIEYTPDRFPVTFWDLFGEQGHPIRATVSEMGPLLLARLLELNDVQEGVLNIAFRVADDANLPVLDLKDLRALLNFVVENADTVSAKYGNVAKASVASVQRQLLMLENQGADKFFGEPALNLQDFMKTDRDGRGVINILAADKLMTKPRLYASFLLWMLSELFEALPEVGDLDKPKLVFFFDEAHLLFNDAPKPLLDAVEQVVRLIRSKGVGVYFVTQNPLDVPQTVLAQLGNRAQHALRAFTPRDQKAVRAAAETFRQNPAFDTAKVIMELAVGEALVSTLEERGTPSIVERTLIAPPTARVGPVTDAERKAIVQSSALRGKYEAAVDSESAYEMLAKRKAMAEQPAQEASTSGGLGGILGKITDALGGGSQPQAQQPGKGAAKGSQRMSATEAIIRSMATSAARSVGTQITRAVLRNVLGGILGSAAGGGGGGGGRRRASRAADLDSGGQGGSGGFMGDMSDLIQGGGGSKRRR